MILVCTWLAFSLKPPSFGVARTAPMTPSDEARQILGANASDQAIIKLVDVLAQAREARAEAREAKAEAEADAREAKAHQVHLQQDKSRLEAEL
ncbi:unnamed protein product, partial [Symbiodinium necroappetens]